MGELGDKLIEIFPPKQREVWLIEDKEIRLNPNNREDKYRRPALVVSAKELLNNKDFPLVNIIPLSRQGKPDKLSFPVASGYEECTDDFKPDSSSLAVLPYYQPIEKKFFKQRCGTIDEITYNAIVNLLCSEVVGCEDFDLNVE